MTISEKMMAAVKAYGEATKDFANDFYSVTGKILPPAEKIEACEIAYGALVDAIAQLEAERASAVAAMQGQILREIGQNKADAELGRMVREELPAWLGKNARYEEVGITASSDGTWNVVSWLNQSATDMPYRWEGCYDSLADALKAVRG